VVLPREDLVDSNKATPSMNKFVENAIDWLAKKAEVKIASDEKRPLSKHTDAVKAVAPKDLASNKEINVYHINSFAEFDDESVKAIQDFVENGGGLLLAGHCYKCDSEALKPSDLPGNK
jgi:hypothetical protein